MSDGKENSLQENLRKRPTSIKLVVKKRARKTSEKSSGILQTRNVNTEQEAQSAGQLKRLNPFGCSASKKANITKPCDNGDNVKLFKTLNQPISSSGTTLILHEECSNTHAQSGVVAQNLTKDTDSSNEEDTTVSVKRLSGTKPPVDWSLKTRVRFTSPCPFNWCSKMLGKNEARGLCNFVQCQDPDCSDNSINFQQNIMYWAHPVLPWMSLFPRLSSNVKLTSNIPNVAENQHIAGALQASWSQSFRSVFNLLRSGFCDYFYLCSAQFTVLFRATLIGSVISTCAFITPTTKGIRDGFDKEGILYTLPALDEAKTTSKYCDSDNEDLEDNPLKNCADDDACWLESMGVGKETLPQLQQSKISQQRAKLRNVDHQGSSLAVITGNHTQALFNYLLNNKSLISKTGSHAGIPPTLLAPVAFHGATLQSYTAKHGVIKQGKNLEQRYSLDITGPILPGNFSKLCQLFESTQQCQFSAAMKNLQATASFNLCPTDMQEQSYNAENVFKQPASLGATCLTLLKCDDSLYSWETN